MLPARTRAGILCRLAREHLHLRTTPAPTLTAITSVTTAITRLPVGGGARVLTPIIAGMIESFRRVHPTAIRSTAAVPTGPRVRGGVTSALHPDMSTTTGAVAGMRRGIGAVMSTEAGAAAVIKPVFGLRTDEEAEEARNDRKIGDEETWGLSGSLTYFMSWSRGF